MAEASSLSVVIPSVNGWSDLRDCLAAVTAQDGGPVQAIVVDRLGEEVRGPLREQFAGVTLIAVPADTTIPAMRRLGIAAATGDVVAIIEDHVIVPRDWARRMLAAQAEGHQAVGGGLVNRADGNLLDWSAFLCEYSHALVPVTGETDWLTGNNTTYRRALLERFRDVLARDQWEGALHEAIRGAGIALVSRPDIVAAHKKHYRPFEYVTQRFLYSKSFAGMRVAGDGAARRAFYGAAALVLPPVLFARVVSRVWRSGRHRPELVKSLPLLAVYVTSWALGETAGAWFGPGDALSKVT